MTGPADPRRSGTAPPASAGEPSAGRLVTTLAGAGAIAGALIVLVFGWTLPAIEAHRARRLGAAIREVLHEPARYDTLYLLDGALVAALPPGADPRRLERVFRGYDPGGRAVGFAIPAAAPGFQDVIQLIFGYDPATGRLLGMKVLENKETPGLGDKIEKDSTFVGQFGGAVPPLVGVKAGAGGDGPERIEMITGATISSRTVIKIINEALRRLGPLLEAVRSEGGA